MENSLVGLFGHFIAPFAWNFKQNRDNYTKILVFTIY